jgi:integrase
VLTASRFVGIFGGIPTLSVRVTAKIPTMPLTDTAIRNAKPSQKPLKFSDGGGLHLLVQPTGGKLWRLAYRFAGKQKTLAFGPYPAVPLSEARKRRDAAKTLLANGTDPGEIRRAEKQTSKLSVENTFKAIAGEWLRKQDARWTESTRGRAHQILDNWIYPWLGERPITAIPPPDLLECLRRIEAKGANDTAHRARQRCGEVFRYAISTGRAERDPTADLRGALAPIVARHRAAITQPTAIGALLRAIGGYDGQLVTRAALQLAPLLFVRPGELRHARWAEMEIDGQEPLWRIPAEQMKMREEHLVPLSRQAVAILSELKPLTGRGRYVFPGARTSMRPMSENTVNAALRRLGYSKDDMTGHGFRAMASTRLNELGFSPDVIERQLAHAERNKVRKAYNRASYLPERRKMMQAWADHLDALQKDQPTHA